MSVPPRARRWLAYVVMTCSLLTSLPAEWGAHGPVDHSDCCCAGAGCGPEGEASGEGSGCCSGEALPGPSLVDACDCSAPGPARGTLSHGVRLAAPSPAADEFMPAPTGVFAAGSADPRPESNSGRPEPPVPRRGR